MHYRKDKIETDSNRPCLYASMTIRTFPNLNSVDPPNWRTLSQSLPVIPFLPQLLLSQINSPKQTDHFHISYRATSNVKRSFDDIYTTPQTLLIV